MAALQPKVGESVLREANQGEKGSEQGLLTFPGMLWRCYYQKSMGTLTILESNCFAPTDIFQMVCTHRKMLVHLDMTMALSGQPGVTGGTP